MVIHVTVSIISAVHVRKILTTYFVAKSVIQNCDMKMRLMSTYVPLYADQYEILVLLSILCIKLVNRMDIC